MNLPGREAYHGTAASFLIILMCCVPALRADDSVQYLGHFDTQFFSELLDVETSGDTAYVSGVSGFFIIDVADPESLQLIGRYDSEGPNERFYQSAVGNGHAYGASRFEGLVVLDLGNPADPTRVSRYQPEDLAFEGVALSDTLLFAAALDQGLRIFNIAQPDTTVLLGSLTDLEAAKRLVARGPFVFAADGSGGLKVIDITDPTAPVLAGSLQTSGAALDVVVQDDIALLAVGSAGVDVVDISNPASPTLLSNFDTPGFAAGIAVQESLVFVADWEGIQVVRITDPTDPQLAGWEDTPARAMGIDAEGIDSFVADWFTFRLYRSGPTDDPDIHLPLTGINFGDVGVGESVDTVVTVENTGGALLSVSGITSSNPDFEIQPVSFTLDPSDTGELQITFTRSFESSTNTTFIISSDDPDESERSLTAQITDARFLQEGELAPDFTLNDLGGIPHSLSDFSGQVVVLAFFASW